MSLYIYVLNKFDILVWFIKYVILSKNIGRNI